MGKRNMFKKMTGVTLLAALLITPLMLTTRNAEASPDSTLCYFGKESYRLGILINIDPDIAVELDKTLWASYSYRLLKKTYRGYELCVRTRRR